jgi:hypothetical protein
MPSGEPRAITTSRPKLERWEEIRERDRQAMRELSGQPFTVPAFCAAVARLLAREV